MLFVRRTEMFWYGPGTAFGCVLGGGGAGGDGGVGVVSAMGAEEEDEGGIGFVTSVHIPSS